MYWVAMLSATCVGGSSHKMQATISGSSTVVRAKHQVCADLVGDVVILDLSSGVYYGLEAVGARIWDLIQEPRTVHELRDALLAEYEIQADRCERELLVLLVQLTEKGLIEVGN